MVAKINKFAENYITVILALAIAIGIFIPTFSRAIKPYALYLFMGVFFLNFIKMDLSKLKDEVKRWRQQIYLALMSLLILPILAYFLALGLVRFFGLHGSFALGALMAFAAPAATITPTLCLIAGAKMERALLNLIVTMLFVPLTLPLLLYVFGHHAKLRIDIQYLVMFLETVILVPLVVALVLRRFLPKVRAKVSELIVPLSVVFIFFVTIGFFAGIGHYFTQHMWVALQAFLLAFVLVCAVFFLSFLLTFKQSMKDRVTAAIVIAWPNIGFVLITAHYFFEKDADLLLFFVSAIMVLLFFITPLQVLSRYLIGLKRGKKSHADAAK